MKHLPLLLKVSGGLCMIFSACAAFLYAYSWTSALFALVSLVTFGLMDMGDSLDEWRVRA